MALKHGGTSDRVLSPIAARWRTWLAEVAPWTSMPMFARDVEAWSWHEAECQVYRAWFDERGIIDEDGGPAGYERWKRADAAAKEARAALGIRPTAWAKFVASLGSADSEVAARSLEHLKNIGRELEAATRETPTRAIGSPDE